MAINISEDQYFHWSPKATATIKNYSPHQARKIQEMKSNKQNLYNFVADLQFCSQDQILHQSTTKECQVIHKSKGI